MRPSLQETANLSRDKNFAKSHNIFNFLYLISIEVFG